MLVIDSYEKLNALLKLLWTVKFDIPSEHSIEFYSSPFIAEIYRETYQAAIDALRKQYLDGEAQRLEEQLSGELNFEMRSVQKHIEFLGDQWNYWDLERKRKYVELLICPFTISAEKIDEIILKAVS